MIDKIKIRESLPSDHPSIEELYPRAFPDEDLLPLVRELLAERQLVLSFVAIVENNVVGHLIFTICGIAGRPEKIALLGPLAIAPAWQRQGFGISIVRAGLRRLKIEGIRRVCVLGDPDYYSRFGFERDDQVIPPYPLPKEWHGAWQSLELHRQTPILRGKLTVPEPWRHRALWTQ